MPHQSNPISTAINAYLAQHDCKGSLRFLANDGKTALIGRLLHNCKMIYEGQVAA